MTRGATINVISTEIIRMYSLHAAPFEYQSKLIISVLCTCNLVGSLFATFVFTWLNNKFGRKITLIISASICIVMNVLSCIAVHWIYLGVVRLFAGLGSSIIMTTMPMMFSEFVKPELRGLYSSLMNYFIGVGAVVCNILQLLLMGHDDIFFVIFLPSIACSLCVFITCLFVKENKASQTRAKCSFLRNRREYCSLNTGSAFC